jgi:hypothetical protein
MDQFLQESSESHHHAETDWSAQASYSDAYDACISGFSVEPLRRSKRIWITDFFLGPRRTQHALIQGDVQHI